jgi:hypothetical protein
VGMRVRMGPVSVSSRGRVGLRAGPVSMYGGGRRRSSSSGGSGALIGVLIAIAIAVFAIMWPLSLWGHVIHLTPSWHQLMNRNHAWEHQHYPLVGLRYIGAAALLVGLLIAGLLATAIPARAKAQQRAAEEQRIAHERTVEEQREHRMQVAEEQRRARIAHEAWLAGPPPVLLFPGRFTQNWIAQHCPGLHPGQLPVLLEELHRRGWSDSDIERRVEPYLPADVTIRSA